MDFKSIQKKCLNNNSNTFCGKSHYMKYSEYFRFYRTVETPQ